MTPPNEDQPRDLSALPDTACSTGLEMAEDARQFSILGGAIIAAAATDYKASQAPYPEEDVTALWLQQEPADKIAEGICRELRRRGYSIS